MFPNNSRFFPSKRWSFEIAFGRENGLTTPPGSNRKFMQIQFELVIDRANGLEMVDRNMKATSAVILQRRSIIPTARSSSATQELCKRSPVSTGALPAQARANVPSRMRPSL
jgi:hypothetical protein